MVSRPPTCTSSMKLMGRGKNEKKERGLMKKKKKEKKKKKKQEEEEEEEEEEENEPIKSIPWFGERPYGSEEE